MSKKQIKIIGGLPNWQSSSTTEEGLNKEIEELERKGCEVLNIVPHRDADYLILYEDPHQPKDNSKRDNMENGAVVVVQKGTMEKILRQDENLISREITQKEIPQKMAGKKAVVVVRKGAIEKILSQDENLSIEVLDLDTLNFEEFDRKVKYYEELKADSSYKNIL